MLEFSKDILDFDGKNMVKSHVFELGDDLDGVILLSTKDKKLDELLYNKILDALLDNVHPKNVYKDFQSILENINAFIENWSRSTPDMKKIHALVGIYHKKTFYFSTIGKASCCLYNSNKDVIEVTEPADTPRNFSFISSGEIVSGEVLMVSSYRLLDVLAKDDIADAVESTENLKESHDAIEYLLAKEDLGKNIGLALMKKNIVSQEQSFLSRVLPQVQYHILKGLDNSFVKSILSRIYTAKDVILKKSKQTQQLLFFGGFFLSIVILYFLISQFLNLASSGVSTDQAKKDLFLAQSTIQEASTSMNNSDAFILKTETAQSLLESLEERALFQNDTKLLREELSILQKQFNGIELFEKNDQNTLHIFDEEKTISKVVKLAGKIYIVSSKSIIGPILSGITPEETFFEQFPEDDRFRDATILGSDIVITTRKGKIVTFSTGNKFFRYADVNDQTNWENSPLIASFGQNIYMLSDAKNQIFRHAKSGEDFSSGTPYLSGEDAKSIGEILAIGIDGGIYILNKEGKIVKLFKSPKYRLEEIKMLKLPRNYTFEGIDESERPFLQAGGNLNYVYMLYKNRILIFKTNTHRFQDVKYLTFQGQIEGKDDVIENFCVKSDKEIVLATSSGVYKVSFEVVDENLMLK